HFCAAIGSHVLVYHSGLITLNSNGAAADDNVTLSNNALLDVSGTTVNYVDGSVAGSSAGWVEMTSANGNIDAQTGSKINLASSAVAGDAGRLKLSAANGSITLNSAIDTAHAAGFDGAKISVDVAQLLDISAFMQGVQSTGFTGSQDYRLRNGDIDILALAGGEANITASEIIIAADNGDITISGKLDASGEQAGRVAVYASGDVVLNGADIDASASIDETGGKVTFGTGNGVIAVDATTQINVAGAANNQTGKVTLRAPRTNTNSDVAISDFSAGVNGAERIDVEGVAVYNDSVIGSAQLDTYRNEAQSWLGNSAAMASRLGLAADSRVHFMPGVEVVSSGNISITDAVDFYQWQQDSASVIDAGTFTVRAADNLDINASISDAISTELLFDFGFGFTSAKVPVLKTGDSWNYQLVSGADLTAANPIEVHRDSDPATGNMQLASGVAVRTGNGDIKISSGGNLVLADQTSVIYTAGQPNDGKFDATILDLSGLPDGPQFADNGGDITINVAENIVGAISDQYFTDWLQRLARLDGEPIPAMWGVVLNDFEQGIATLGGGDITVSAGGTISDLSLSTPRTGQVDVNDNVVIRGGGDIDVFAGGDYRSGRVLADGGKARFRVRGDMAADNGVQTLLAMGDAQLRIEAGGDIGVGGIGNVTMLPMSTNQSNGFSRVNDIRNYFFTYGDDSKVELVSHYGDIVIDNDITAITNVANNLVAAAGGNTFSLWSIYPGDFSATTLTGDIQINDSFTLYPDADGNLQLLAGGDIVSGSNAKIITVLVSDAAIAGLPDLSAADLNLFDTDLRLLGDKTDPTRHDFNAPVHENDVVPVRVVANGDIAIDDPLKLVLPKKAQIYAGGDITDLAVEIQNLKFTDKSLFIAGGDIRYTIPDSSVSTFVSAGIKVTGPGSIDVIAGGDIDLGISRGIRSLGNVDNNVLPEQGADIAVYAGATAEVDSAAFISTYFSGSKQGDAALVDIDVAGYQQQLIAYVQSPEYGGDLADAVTAVTGVQYNNRESAINAFNQLDETQRVAVAIASFSDSANVEQRGLLLDVLFDEINLAASQQAATGDDTAYARGFLAIDRLFHSVDTPLTNTNSGDISLPFSRILSTSGGEINLLAPNGELTVGFTSEVKNSSENDGALGVIVSGQGDLSVLTGGNINVNLSRMLTLDGGDISMWASNGDIDAGRGAKSQLTIPPPLTIVNKLTGQIQVIFPPAVSGSGIGAASFTPGQTPGKVTLAAPGGVINASDAGIRSDGDLVLAANKVLGADNISAGGTAVGIPVATNVTAGLTGLSSSTDSAINGANESIASATADAVSNDGVALVTVELLGIGEEPGQ
ncbi:MAG: filamentous hemagglutinin family protein, partial [Gammaproteobacteria bacterium]|nr:filamentous hemagglutinin family protein [Gammaproteobacteria bacterium]